MIVKNIHIDNYGSFANVSCTGLEPGLNVVCGPNEYGKTTLLEFVRRILFGFPNRKFSGNLYLPVDGSQPGGSLICELDDGSAVTIKRHGLAKGGALNIVRADGQEFNDPGDLMRLLQATESFYRNVYAVTIDELYSMEALRHEEIKSRIYGAGLGLGGVSLAAVRKELQDKAEQIFKPRGQNQLIAKIKGELRELAVRIKESNEILPQYERSLEESRKLREEIATMQEQGDIRLRELKRLKSWNQVYEDLLRYNEIEIALRRIPETAGISDDDIESWQKLEAASMTAHAGLERCIEEHRRCRGELDALKPNQALLDLREEVVALERSAERYRSDIAAQRQLVGQREEISSSLETASGELANLGVDASRAATAFGMAEVKRAEYFKHRFEELRRFSDMFKLIASSASISPSRRFFNDLKIILPLVLIALAVVVAGLLLNIEGFLLAGGVMAGAGILFGFTRYLLVRDSGRGAAIAEIKEKADCCEVLDSEWHAFLAGHGLSGSLTPEAFLAAAEIHRELTRKQCVLARLETEIAEKQAWLDSIKDNFSRAATYVSGRSFSGEIASDIAIVSEAFRAAEAELRERDKLTAETERLDAEIATGRKRLDELRQEQERLLKKFGVADGGELKQGRGYTLQRSELNDKLTDLKIRIKAAFGADAGIDEIRCQLKDFSPTENELKTAALERDEAESQTLLAEKNQRLGELTNQRKSLVSGDELVLLRNRHEQKLEELRSASSQWAKYVVADALIERAVGKYEQERQPAVISRASALFAAITAQRYHGIRKPLDRDNLMAIAASDKERDIMELSRGTREQLYLAMRFGLIEQYEARSEKLPVMLDDILVDFDDRRLLAAVEAIDAFAVGRQVIVLTCHSRLRDILIEAGANQAAFTSQS